MHSIKFLILENLSIFRLMLKGIKYPVGLQSFGKIRKGGYLYIDKSRFVYRLATKGEYVFLSRPRRFGKSLLLSTLECYFRGESHLFDGLEIASLEKEWITYPVFRFDLSGESYTNPEKLLLHINYALDDIEDRYGLVSEGTISRRLQVLIREAHKKFSQPVVILVDEYDKPLLDCLHDELLQEQIKTELRAFYSVLKMSDEHIRFCMITGVTKFSQVAIFSGFNNLKDISLHPDYNAVCGISETEFYHNLTESIENFSEVTGFSHERVLRLFKDNYDGYRFASTGENIYNPFSVLYALSDSKIGNYWYSSGSSTFLVNLVRRTGFILSSLEGEKRTGRQLSDLSGATSDFASLLYQSGYLTIKNYDAAEDLYTLGFPNMEVYKGFWESLAENIFIGYGAKSTFNLKAFLDDINYGHPSRLMERFRALLADTGYSQNTNQEIHFQNMLAIACKMMGLGVGTEVRSSEGRCDMQIKSAAYVYIIEFKIDKPAEVAIAQIRDKGYARPFAMDSRTVYLIGASFSSRSRTLESWIIEELAKPSV